MILNGLKGMQEEVIELPKHVRLCKSSFWVFTRSLPAADVHGDEATVSRCR